MLIQVYPYYQNFKVSFPCAGSYEYLFFQWVNLDEEKKEVVLTIIFISLKPLSGLAR